MAASMDDLTEDDYDALYTVVRADMPRLTRSIFPNVLARLVRDGEISITVTDTEIAVRLPDRPGVGAYRVQRMRRLH